MAKQNFLNGGYIGKLGNTVGQRWKDKKIVRTYAIPANPNTPAQQEVRQLFATANRLAQQAMTINGHQGVWDTSQKPEYSQRVGQAMRRLRLGYSEQDSLPLYPEGQSPAVAVEILGYSYDFLTNTYTFNTRGFGAQAPSAMEISFYSPLFYLNGAFTENVIHAQVNYAQNTFTVDLSASNTTDGQQVKTNFQQAMNLGFVAMQAEFYDNMGAFLNNISFARKYAIANQLYDFDQSLSIVETSDKIVFAQNFTAGAIQGTVNPVTTAGFPMVYKVSSVNTYYAGLSQETLNSTFITQNANTPQQFSLISGHNSGNLEESTATTWALTVGATQPRIYKDTSTFQYPQPLTKPVLQNATLDPNYFIFEFDQDLAAVGAYNATLAGNYYDVTAADPTQAKAYQVVGAATITTNTVRVPRNANPNIQYGWIGTGSFTFSARDSSAIPELSCQIESSFSGVIGLAQGTATETNNTTVGNYSGKTIGGNWTASIANSTAYGNNYYHKLAAKLTYIDGTSETKTLAELTSFPTNAATAKTISGFTAGKEIRTMEFLDLSANGATGTNAPNISRNTITVPERIILDTLAWDYDYKDLSFDIPQDFPPFLKTWQATAYSIDAGTGLISSDPEDITLQAPGTTQTYTFQTANGEGFAEELPIWMENVFLYEDGTGCTSIRIRTYSPASNVKTPIGDSEDTLAAYIETATVNASAGNSVTLTVVSDTRLPAGNTIYCKTTELEAVDGTLIAELDGEGTVLTENSVRIETTGNYVTGTNYNLRMDSTPGFWTGVQSNLEIFYTE